MLLPGELAELYVAHQVLKSAYEYLCNAGRLANLDAMLILLDARVVIQEELVAQMFGEG